MSDKAKFTNGSHYLNNGSKQISRTDGILSELSQKN